MIADPGVGLKEPEGLLLASQQVPASVAGGVLEAAPVAPSQEGMRAESDPLAVADLQAQSVRPGPAIFRPQVRATHPENETAVLPGIPTSGSAQPLEDSRPPAGVPAAGIEPDGPKMDGQPKAKPVPSSYDDVRSDTGEPVVASEVTGPPVLALETQVQSVAVPAPPGPVVPQPQTPETRPGQRRETAAASALPSSGSGQSLPASRLAAGAAGPVAGSGQQAPEAEAEPLPEAAPEQINGQETPVATQPFGKGVDDSGAPLLPRSGFETKLPQVLGTGLVQAKSEPVAHSTFGTVYPAQDAGPVVEGRPGVAGRAMGVEIARAIARGRDEMIVRLSPENLGRVEVRIAFDSEGALQAVLSTDQPATTALLQREAPNLVRALADAGIRSDDSSVRFQTPGDGGQSGAWSGDRNQGSRQDRNQQGGQSADEEYPIRSFRAIRAGSRVDLIA